MWKIHIPQNLCKQFQNVAWIEVVTPQPGKNEIVILPGCPSFETLFQLLNLVLSEYQDDKGRKCDHASSLCRLGL